MFANIGETVLISSLSSTASDIRFNNSCYLMSVLTKDIITDLKSLLKIGIATKDDAAVGCLLRRCCTWKMNKNSGELFVWMLKLLCHSHRYKSIIDASHFMILNLFDNLILSFDVTARFNDGKKQVWQCNNVVHSAIYFDIILYILNSYPTNKIFLSCKCEEYLMRLMNICISSVNEWRAESPVEAQMSVPLYQITTFLRTIVFVYQDVVSRNMEDAWKKFISHINNLCTPAELKTITLGRQIDSFRTSFWAASHSSNDRVGLQNQGNTCYQNAILQILFMSDSFANAILSINLLDLRKNLRALQLAQSMRKIFAMLIFSHRPYISGDTIGNFRRKLCVPFNGFKQQDASEFLYSLLDNILTNFNMPHVEKIFRGKFETQICCKRCKNVVSSLFPFLGLQVAFPSEISGEENPMVTGHKVSDLLQNYCSPEALEGSNAYFCERCNAKVCAIKQTVVAEIPEILVITIKRFYYDMSGTISGKICHPLHIEPTIQLRDNLLDLYGVVTHHGSSLNSGHYTATASHSKSRDTKWWHFDDSAVKRLDSTTIHNIKNAYMLFYRKRDVFPPTHDLDSSHRSERNMEPTSFLHYYSPLSSDMLEPIRYDNCKYLLELFSSADSTRNSEGDSTLSFNEKTEDNL